MIGRTPEELRRLVKENNLKEVKALLEHKVEQTADQEGNTPLHLAVQNGSSEIVRLLLEHGADRGAVNKNGLTPILMMLSDWHKLGNSIDAVIKEFVKYPDRDNKGRYGNFIVQLTRKKINTDLIIAVLNAGVQPTPRFVLKESGSNMSYSEMGWAIKNEDLRLFNEFLKKGYDPFSPGSGRELYNLLGKLGASAFNVAIQLRKNEFVQACLKASPEKAKASIIKSLMKQLEKYRENAPLWGGHEGSAGALVKDLKMANGDIAKAQKMLKAANNAFKTSHAIVIHKDTPRYALPKKNKNEDGYTNIIKDFQQYFDFLCRELSVNEEKEIIENVKVSPLIRNSFREEARRDTSPTSLPASPPDFTDEIIGYRPPGSRLQ